VAKKKRKYKVILAGCGGMSERWMDCRATRNNAEIVGFVDPFTSAAEKRANEYGVPNAVVGTNLAKVIKETQADVLYDVSIPEAHYKNTLTALSKGLHVMGEKPMADTLARGKKMVAAAKKSRRRYTVIQNRRYSQNIQILKNALDSGIIGDVHTLQSDFRLGVHFGGFREDMDHPLILDMAIHTFDAARFLSGTNAEKVFCRAFNPAGSWYNHGASANAFFEMSKGVSYTYNGSWCSLGKNTTWECDWVIQGTKGAISWDGGDNFDCEVIVKKKGFKWPVKKKQVPLKFKKSLADGHNSNIQDFFDAIRSGKKAMTDCADNIKSLAMVHGAIKSDKLGRLIPVQA